VLSFENEYENEGGYGDGENIVSEVGVGGVDIPREGRCERDPS
jgi:hypothetical protein